MTLDYTAVGSTVVLRGEIDMENASELMPVLAAVRDQADGAVTLDVTDLAFIDSAGIGAICLLLIRDDIPFKFIGAAGSVRRTLAFAGLIDQEDPS